MLVSHQKSPPLGLFIPSLRPLASACAMVVGWFWLRGEGKQSHRLFILLWCVALVD